MTYRATKKKLKQHKIKKAEDSLNRQLKKTFIRSRGVLELKHLNTSNRCRRFEYKVLSIGQQHLIETYLLTQNNTKAACTVTLMYNLHNYHGSLDFTDYPIYGNLYFRTYLSL